MSTPKKIKKAIGSNPDWDHRWKMRQIVVSNHQVAYETGDAKAPWEKYAERFADVKAAEELAAHFRTTNSRHWREFLDASRTRRKLDTLEIN
jgi:hypothetical protein